jgi:hypothetical protein
MPLRNALLEFPKNGPGVNAHEYPINHQQNRHYARDSKLCINTAKTFFLRTMPP